MKVTAGVIKACKNYMDIVQYEGNVSSHKVVDWATSEKYLYMTVRKTSPENVSYEIEAVSLVRVLTIYFDEVISRYDYLINYDMGGKHLTKVYINDEGLLEYEVVSESGDVSTMGYKSFITWISKYDTRLIKKTYFNNLKRLAEDGPTESDKNDLE